MDKSLLVLFFRKELLSSNVCVGPAVADDAGQSGSPRRKRGSR
jgi:hypothetical protein